MAKATEFLARTVVNLPFTEKRYEPGTVIPRSAFEAEADAAAKIVDDRTDKDPGATPIPTADETIAYFMEWGTITDDLDAEVHPDHIIPDPNRPSMAALVAQAQALVEIMENEGAEVPAKLRALADISDRQISTVENVTATVETQSGGEAK